MNYTKVIGGIISGALVLAGALGVPGLDTPETAALVDKISMTLGGAVYGWLFLRQQWLGQGKP